MRKRAMSSWNFERIYDPIDSPDGSMVFEFKDTKPYGANNVWSLVDGDNGEPYVVPGYHVVNVFGYTVTRKPWTDQDVADGLVAKW